MWLPNHTLQFDFLIPPTFWFSPIFRFFLLDISQEVFSINHLDLSIFFYQSLKEFGGFSLIDSPIFFYHFLLGFWRFFIYATFTTTFIIYLHACRSLRSRKEAIVMTWSRDLVTWHGTYLIQLISRSYDFSLKHHYLLTYNLRLIYNLCLWLRPTLNITPSALQLRKNSPYNLTPKSSDNQSCFINGSKSWKISSSLLKLKDFIFSLSIELLEGFLLTLLFDGHTQVVKSWKVLSSLLHGRVGRFHPHTTIGSHW